MWSAWLACSRTPCVLRYKTVGTGAVVCQRRWGVGTGFYGGRVVEAIPSQCSCLPFIRTPNLHLLFVIIFFPAYVAYMMSMTSVYRMLAKDATLAKDRAADFRRSWLSLRRSYAIKRRICYVFMLFVSLYLPIGMSFVSDW